MHVYNIFELWKNKRKKGPDLFCSCNEIKKIFKKVSDQKKTRDCKVSRGFFLLFILKNRSDRIRDCYIFLPVSLCEVLYEDVLEHVFVGQLFGMQNDIEVDG